MTWYYESEGQQKGPISDADLDRLLLEGKILPGTLVWRQGQANWAPLQQARPGGPVAASSAAAGTVQCDSCGRFFDPTDLVDLQGRQICAGCKPAILQRLQQGNALPELTDPRRTGPAWEHRATLGWWPALRDTVKAVLFQPGETFATMRTTGGLTNPFWYTVITGGLGSVMLTIYLIAAQLIFAKHISENGIGTMPMFFGAGVTVMSATVQIIYSFVMVAIFSFVQSGILHVCLMLCGGARRPFETTFRAYCYSSGSVALLSVVPIIGSIVAIPWSLVVSCTSLARAHETDLWRAVVAIFLPGIVCCTFFILIAVAVGGMISASHGFR